MRLLILGATGLVGGHVLERALADQRVGSVAAPTRRKLAPHAKLSAPPVDYEALDPEDGCWRADAVVCALGTTIRKAGSQDAFRRVDHDHPMAAARLALARGARSFALNSALGADVRSRFFYGRVKGELERDLEALGFPSLTFVRPGLIGGDRREARPAERLASIALGALGPILPRAYRINPAARIAEALLDAAVEGRPGVRVVSSAELV